MVKHYIVTRSPNHSKIMYDVHVADNIEETFASLVEEIRHECTAIEEVVIFCRAYDEASCIYLFLRSQLGKFGLQPIGAPDLALFRLVEVFTACTKKDVNYSVLSLCTKPEGIL